ncbi:MAG: carbohydrate binding family 9 domain-containing protein [Planctomycetes bacterium]|nr:carbohydrate binding family 9 domain-containing protein [Planctomycetota bacterium]
MASRLLKRALVAALALVAPLLDAQEPTESARRVATIGTIDEAQAPQIDGRLDDACWDGAPAIGELLQLEPQDGALATQPTVVRLLHDRHAIYVAIQCFDDAPDTIRATQRARDADLDPDDRVEIWFDTFASRRNAYWFQIGAAGSRGDSLISDNGARFTKSFDCIWHGHARITRDGWEAELAIPFQSLAFAPDSTEWGFNLRRELRARNATDQWTNVDQASSFFRVGEGGTLAGFGRRDGGLGLDVKPYVAVAGDRVRALPATSSTSSSDVDAGVDLSYRLTPGLTLGVTTFTDFAETEGDDRRINLSRFPLFFPEKRDFFLADASRFEFGPRANGERLLPFFSRRIGRDDSGREIPLLAGLRVAGQEGPWEIGALGVRMGEGEAGLEPRTLGVLRVKRHVGAQGAVGLIATAGDPTDDASAQTLGVDGTQRLTEVFGGDLRLSAYAMQTFGGFGEGHALGVDLSGQTRTFNYALGGRRIEDDFAPALGFTRRTGVWQQYGELEWKPRPGGSLVRNFEFGVDDRADVRIQDGVADEVEFDFTVLGVEFESSDEVRFGVRRSFESLDDPFEIVDGVFVPAGDYASTMLEFEVSTSDGRPFNAGVGVRIGDLYDGDQRELGVELAWRTGPTLILGASYDQTDASLASGDFTTHIGGLRADLHLSPDLSWRNLAQYDTESRDLGVQSRLRWTVQPGSDLFVVFGAGWLRTDDGALRPEQQQATLKFAWTFRF